MATFEDLMRAASNADKAGDEDAARRLVAAAQALRAIPNTTDPIQSSAGPIPRADVPREQPPAPPVDRFGDTFRAAVEGPLEATKHFAAQSQDRSRSRLERAGDYAMTGLNALGTGVAAVAGGVGEVLGGSPTNERKLARDLMMGGAVAIPELAGVSSVAAAAGRAASRAGQAAPPPRNVVEAGKRAADDLGVTPSLGSGGKVRGMTAAGLEKVPLAGEFIARDAARYVDEIESATTRIKSGIGTASVPSEAGDILQSGLVRYRDRMKTKAEEKFARVAEFLPPETPVDLGNTVRVIADVKQHFQALPELQKKLGLNDWDSVISEASENGIGWQAVRQLRSEIGEAIGSNRGALADESVGRLKRLYEALTLDMETTALSAGDDAVRAWKDANNFYRNFAQRVEKYLDKTIAANSPERAFEAFANMARKDAASADVTRMRSIKASLKPQEWRDVSASIVDRIGKPTPGQQDAFGDGFSPARFLTQWNSMSDEAKRLLLPEDVRIELQKVAEVAEVARNANAERNFSNTGTVTGLAALFTGAQFAPATTAASFAGATIGARAMTSATFLRALNRAGRGDLKQMKAMAEGNGAFAQDARAVLQILGAETAAAGGANQNARPLQRAQ